MKLEREHERLVESNEKLEQSYKELNIAKKKAEESSKMKTDFIQQISHEIRTPLNILSGFTQVITTPGMVLDETTRNDINQRITENTNRITELVNKMLALSEANSRSVIDSHEDVHAVQIAAQAVDESRISTNKHVAFDMQFSPEMEEVVMHTNLEESTRALTMLLDNAQKFQKERHPMAKETQIGHVRLLLNKHQRFVDFIVEDDGIGIPAGEAEHIFEEFVQLDNYYSGTGIGLTIARSIARRLGGNIVLDTSYEDGARFVMTLPINSDNDKKQIKL
jgi:signal transduction histidine kinase